MSLESKDNIKKIAEVAQYIYNNSSKSILECIEIAKYLNPEIVAALSDINLQYACKIILTEEKEFENGSSKVD